MQTLWEFSLTFYAKPGVAAACLLMQDRDGADVNLVLFALWSATRGCRLDRVQIRAAIAAVAAWQAGIVTPLRQVRRQLTQSDATPDRSAFRAQVKAAELEAERQEQQILQSCASDPAPRRSRDGLARDNLQVYGATLARPPASEDVETLLAALAQMTEAGRR